MSRVYRRQEAVQYALEDKLGDGYLCINQEGYLNLTSDINSAYLMRSMMDTLSFTRGIRQDEFRQVGRIASDFRVVRVSVETKLIVTRMEEK